MLRSSQSCAHDAEASMNNNRLVSIVINSYNYGSFLRTAIDSALQQTYGNTEVIVVDDGSTDDSPEIINSYNGRIRSILKRNGGQASALNAGFAASHGDTVIFLDSDDMLLPTAVESMLPFFNPDVVKVHWPLVEVDELGRETGGVSPDGSLSEGDLRAYVLREGPYSYTWPDTSGNAWARWFLERVLPMPEEEYRTSPDLYLCAFAPLHGLIRALPTAQAVRRLHANNHSCRDRFQIRLKAGVERDRHCLTALANYCHSIGADPDEGRWFANSWWYRVQRATEAITKNVPAGRAFILVDEDQWWTDEYLEGRRRIKFLEEDGCSGGPPDDGNAAVAHIVELRERGAGHLVFGWPAFWWLDYYEGLETHLRSRYRCVHQDDAAIVFDLRL
jgi:glycosyltransferase involved in cell wall biosynthesis